MQANGSSYIGYEGNVELTFFRNGTKIVIKKKNAGVKNLFRILCRALAGYDISGEIPSFLDLRVVNGSSTSSILNNKIALTGKSYRIESNDWVLKITGTIAYSDLMNPEISESSTYRLYLMNTSADLAYLNVEATDLAGITEGTQMLVNWTLKFQNLNGSQE